MTLCEPCRLLRPNTPNTATYSYTLAHKGERPTATIPICYAHALVFERFAGSIRYDTDLFTLYLDRKPT